MDNDSESMDSDDSTPSTNASALPARKVLYRRVKRPKRYADYCSVDDPEVLESAGAGPPAKRGQSLLYDELFTDESSLSSQDVCCLYMYMIETPMVSSFLLFFLAVCFEFMFEG